MAWPSVEATAGSTPTDISAPAEPPVATKTSVVTEVPAPLVVPAPKQTMLLSGTEVALRLRTELTTKEKLLKVGDRFDLETVDSIKLGTLTVIPAGTRAIGEITSVRNKGMWGKSGRFEARLLHLQTPDRNIRLAGAFTDKGTSGGWGAVGATLLSPVILPIGGFFVTGTSARLPAGTIVKSYLDEDVPVVTTSHASAEQPSVHLVQ
jgi:hypothetical protein